MTAIATVIPITKQPAPLTHKPFGAGMLVEYRNGLDIVQVIPGNNGSSKHSFMRC